jgi:hypothetical protein
MTPGDNDHSHAHDNYEARLITLKEQGYTDEEIEHYMDQIYNNG